MPKLKDYLLILEDSPAEAHLLREAFTIHQFPAEIVMVHSGKKFLAFIDSEKNPLPRMIVMDLRLPDHDGLEILQQIKQDATLSQIPVIIRTGSIDPRDEQTCLDLGVLDFMVKKIGFDSIEDQILSIKNHWSDLSA